MPFIKETIWGIFISIIMVDVPVVVELLWMFLALKEVLVLNAG
jgi:hypothetical protein